MTARVQKVAEGSAWWKGASPRQSVANSLLQHATSPPIHPKKKIYQGRQRALVKQNLKKTKSTDSHRKRDEPRARNGSAFANTGSRQSPASWARVQKHGALSRGTTTRPASLDCATTESAVGAQPSAAAVLGARLPFPQAKRPSRRTPCRQAITLTHGLFG